MNLARLIDVLERPHVIGTLEREICEVSIDSRCVREGSMFVAVRGERADGHDFLSSAVAAGARALVVDRTHSRADAYGNATVIAVDDTRKALSRLAARLYGNPSQAMTIVGVTGTNGKTTVTYLVEAILHAASRPAGRIGTLGARFGERVWPLENTTPLAPELQRTLAEMRDLGAVAAAMEVSSHALALDRVADVRFSVGVLTNVTRDHLDFHGTLEAYAAAKRSLFDRAEIAVLNADDAYGRAWARELRDRGARCLTYGMSSDADVRARNVELKAAGTRFEVAGRTFASRLPGRFNVSNALAALSVASVLGISDAVAGGALEAFDRVPGRMEHLGNGAIDVLVDYAHTPDALENVLRAARETAAGRVIAVFGCGGDRDRGKRPQMGKIASELADVVFVTSDNPRTEEPHSIIDQITAGIADRSRAIVEIDRAAAIVAALRQAARGDVVVIAGKGHETYQIVGTQKHHFDDREIVRAFFETERSSG